MRAECLDHPEKTWAEGCVAVAADAEIDQYGMTLQRLEILKALGQHGPMSLNRLCGVAACEEETLRSRVLPPLLTGSPGEPSLVGVTHRHFITPAGLKELDKRGIRHLGDKALPQDYVDLPGEQETDAEED